MHADRTRSIEFGHFVLSPTRLVSCTWIVHAHAGSIGSLRIRSSNLSLTAVPDVPAVRYASRPPAGVPASLVKSTIFLALASTKKSIFRGFNYFLGSRANFSCQLNRYFRPHEHETRLFLLRRTSARAGTMNQGRIDERKRVCTRKDHDHDVTSTSPQLNIRDKLNQPPRGQLLIKL